LWGVGRLARQTQETDARTSSAFIAELMTNPKDECTRKPQKVEAYINLFYDEKVKPVVKGASDVPQDDVMAAAGTGKLPKAELHLVTIMNQSRKLLQEETDEVKALVDQRWQEMVIEKQKQVAEGGKKKADTQ
jgi:hypothetical protein